MENLTTQKPKNADQMLTDLIYQKGAKELRESLREMFFAALRSEWSNYMEDRTMYLTDFESIDTFLKDLEVFEAAHLETLRLQRESKEAERSKGLENRLDKKIEANEQYDD